MAIKDLVHSYTPPRPRKALFLINFPKSSGCWPVDTWEWCASKNVTVLQAHHSQVLKLNLIWRKVLINLIIFKIYMDISKIIPREEEENIAETRKSWSPKLPGCAEDKREPTRAEVSAFCWGFATTYKLLGFFSPCFDLKGVVPCLAWNVVQTWNLLNSLHQFYLRKSVNCEMFSKQLRMEDVLFIFFKQIVIFLQSSTQIKTHSSYFAKALAWISIFCAQSWQF